MISAAYPDKFSTSPQYIQDVKAGQFRHHHGVIVKRSVWWITSLVMFVTTQLNPASIITVISLAFSTLPPHGFNTRYVIAPSFRINTRLDYVVFLFCVAKPHR